MEVIEVSLEYMSTLDSFQAGAFTLFTVAFNAVGMGSSTISLADVTLANSYGGDLSYQINNGQVDVNSTGKTGDAPEPGSLWLLASGLLTWFVSRRFQTRAN